MSCTVYTKDVWNSLCALQSYDASTDPSTVNNAALRLAQCAYMLHKHDATGELPPAVLDALDVLDLSTEPKRGSYKPPHPMDSIEFAKTFDLGKFTTHVIYPRGSFLMLLFVFLIRSHSQYAHQFTNNWRGETLALRF